MLARVFLVGLLEERTNPNPNPNPNTNPDPDPNPNPNPNTNEVITVEPTSLTDVVVLSLWHRRRKGGIAERRPALVGETRVPVLSPTLSLYRTPTPPLFLTSPLPSPLP